MIPGAVMDKVYVQCNSHRTRDRMISTLGYSPVCYVTLRREVGVGVFEIKSDELQRVLAIKGLKKVGWKDDLRRTWKS